MEIRHTVEILTKDIQDIEKLVRNLNNYEHPPQIEIDLAMSKLRNVYELLSIISRDLKSDQRPAAGTATVQPEAPSPVADQPRQSPGATGAPVDQPQSRENSQDAQQGQGSAEHMRTASSEESAGQAQQAPAKDQKSQPAQPLHNEQSPGQVPQQKNSAQQEQTSQQEHVSRQEQASRQEQSTQQKQAPEKEQPKKEEARKTSILAEKFASDPSLNEKIAPGSAGDLSSKLTGEPIESIKRNIGINDRFLIIRELLNGNNDAFNNLVQQLDTQQNFDDAYSIIQSEFPDQMEHEGVNLLVRLSRRRYLSK